MQKQTETFVESIRYPFTGTLSVQPQKAKLMEQGLVKHTLAVPGAPELDMPKLSEIVDSLREYVGLTGTNKESLISQREKAWSEGREEDAKKFTDAIKIMMEAINSAYSKICQYGAKVGL